MRRVRQRSPGPWVVLLSLTTLTFLSGSGCSGPGVPELTAGWEDIDDRSWAGPLFWANRLQDWRVQGGRLEAVKALPMRTAHLLTATSRPASGELEISVRMGFLPGEDDSGAGGILLGAGGPDMDHRRAALIHHSPGPGGGLFLGVDAEGHLTALDFARENRVLARSDEAVPVSGPVDLVIGVATEDARAEVTLTGRVGGGPGDEVRLGLPGLPLDQVTGNLALVSHSPSPESARSWFSQIGIRGNGAELHLDRTLGPVLGAQHTLSTGLLSMTAQLFPVGKAMVEAEDAAPDSVILETANTEGAWTRRGVAPVVVPGYTATLRIPDWTDSDPVPYRLLYQPSGALASSSAPRGQDLVAEPLAYQGTIRPDPLGKDLLVVAAFTGNHNVASPGLDQGAFDWEDGLWFPHEDIIDGVAAHAPDFLFFSGDQVYEGASPTRADFDEPYHDYLYKWYLWLWAFRDLTADIPSVAIPDDHDVFHGNVWGAGGRATPPGMSGANAQDQGGYKLHPEWVNMVQRTQTAHLPPPVDPEPVEQGIGVYFTDILYGGVSFAVIEDRKFKSPPKLLLPRAGVWNGWAQNPDFDAAGESDVPGASLLGARQEAFLEDWAEDWTDGTWMKVLLSQTLFQNVATIPSDAMSGSVIPTLPIPEPDEWVEGDKVAADMDSNGWPSSGRDRALRAIRRGFAVHLAGDQHLGSTIQYGLDTWRDGPFALCVPSVANFWPRRWYPPEPGLNREVGAPAYTGDFRDGFGNLMTVHAVSNPAQWDRDPARLHNRAPGYGIARFRKSTREVSLEAWPRWADPREGGEPYPGWPVRFQQEDGYGPDRWGSLPTLEIIGMTDPVVRVSEEPSGEILYTIRIEGNRFSPVVFAPGSYTLAVGEPGTDDWQVFLGIQASRGVEGMLEVRF